MHDRTDHPLAVSEVRIRMAEPNGDGLVAWASCVLEGSIFLNDIAVRRTPGGELVLRYPAKRSRRDVKYFTFRPIHAGAKEALDRAILGPEWSFELSALPGEVLDFVPWVTFLAWAHQGGSTRFLETPHPCHFWGGKEDILPCRYAWTEAAWAAVEAHDRRGNRRRGRGA